MTGFLPQGLLAVALLASPLTFTAPAVVSRAAGDESLTRRRWQTFRPG